MPNHKRIKIIKDGVVYLSCSRCNLNKIVNEFSTQPNRSTGRRAKCKTCERELTALYKAKNRVKIALMRMGKKRNKRSWNISKESFKKYAMKNKEKRRAKRLVYNVFRYRDRPTLQCYFCRKKAVVFHHENYSLVYDIIPLCHRCHSKLHNGYITPIKLESINIKQYMRIYYGATFKEDKRICG